MTGSSNFLLFDSAGTNMLSDSDYNASSGRAGGVVDGLASPTLHNKTLYQLSAMVYALAQVAANAGYTMADNSPTGLVTSLTSLINTVKAIASKSANYTVLLGDIGTLFTCSSTFTLALTASATLGAGWYCFVKNDGAGVVTIDPNASETINGNATQTLYPGQSAMIFCDGSNLRTVGCPPLYPTKYLGGPPPKYASASTITLPAGMRARDGADAADIQVTSNLTLSTGSVGANALDAGTVAASTWYYVYLIKKSSDGTVASLFSTVNESVSGSITLPSGYDTKRQLPIAIKTDGSNNIIPFTVTAWGNRACVRLDVAPTYFDSSFNLGVTNILNAGTATSYTAVGASSFIPPISRRGIFNGATSTSGRGRVRQGGSSIEGFSFGAGSTAAEGFVFECPTDSSQQVEYKRQSSASPNLYLDVMGYWVTEMN